MGRNLERRLSKLESVAYHWRNRLPPSYTADEVLRQFREWIKATWPGCKPTIDEVKAKLRGDYETT